MTSQATEIEHGSDPYTTPHAASAALILIDVQRDFYTERAPARIEGTAAAIPAMAELTAAFRAARRPILHVIRLYHPDGSNVDAVRRRSIEQGARVAVPGSAGSRIAPELLPAAVELDHERLLRGEPQRLGPAEFVLYKPRWGAFYRTVLEDLLRELAVDTLVFAGCNFPNCPRTSIYQASERDFRIVLVADAISGLYERGTAEMRAIGVEVRDRVSVSAWLSEA